MVKKNRQNPPPNANKAKRKAKPRMQMRMNPGNRVSNPVEPIARPINEQPKSKGIGESIGGWIGNAAESLFRKVTGLGDYSVNHNTVIEAGGPPIFDNLISKKSTVIRHREFISDVTGSTSFQTQQLIAINSGNPQFPFLSLLGSNYEQYRLHGMLFEYRPTSGVAVSGSNPALGTVIMSTQYNSLNPPFTDKVSMENYEFTVSTVPSIAAAHPIECKPDATSIPLLYSRGLNTPIMGDARLYDLGLFQLATVGMQEAGDIVGELWCTYECELIKPKILKTPSAGIQLHMLLGKIGTIPNPSSIFGTFDNFISNSVYGTGTNVQPTWVTQNSINLGVLPVGSYVVDFYVNGSSTASVVVPALSLTGAIALNLYNWDGLDHNSYPSVATTSGFCWLRQAFQVVTPLSSGNILVFSGGTFPSAISTVDLFVQGTGLTG